MTEELTVAEFKKVKEAILKHSSSDGEVINLGNLIEIKPVYTYDSQNNKTLDGYDVYQYADQELMKDDNYDFDSDYICTIYL